ncbi:MAG TPA: Flp pilus assembly protein CpaB [Rickettsiales bacterium]|nr:Flp pilus assembly protein CpaB [Rickettsiales bacterium]
MRLIIMFIAIALSAGAFFITMHFTSNSPAPTQQAMPIVETKTVMQTEPTVDVYTAKQDIPIGTVVTQDMLDLRPWPKNLVLPDMNLVDPSKPSEAVNMIARTPFQKGEPIIMNRLANANDPSFLAASLMPGMRLITLAVDTISGGGGFIYPGDRVDVLITHDVSSEIRYDTSTTGITQKTIDKQPTTEILIGDVRVMATNQKSTAHGGDAPVPPTDISLEVAPEDAQKIRLAENGNGRLSLVLRSLKDQQTKSGPVAPSELSNLSAVRSLPAPDDNSILVVRNVKAQSVGIPTP